MIFSFHSFPASLIRTIRPTARRTFVSTSRTLQSYSTQEESILKAALPHVHQHGWTEQALAQGVLTSKLPPSYIGLIEDKKSELIHFFMKNSNKELEYILQQTDIEGQNMTHSQVIEVAMRKRLEMNVPYIKSQRWAEGMALGAMPLNACHTANHLEQLMIIIENAMMRCNNNGVQASPLGILERGALGAVYIATELHLLSDNSTNQQDTWNFLHQRVEQLEQAATGNLSVSSLVPNSDTLVAGAAVASSLGGAVLSLVAPAAGAGIQSITSSVMPAVLNMMQPPSVDSTVGTKAQDYDFSDLPPFESDIAPEKSKSKPDASPQP